MATNMKRTTKSQPVEKTEVDVNETEKRVFQSEDLIPCKSITPGELLMEGYKTHFVYKWADYDDVQDVEYQDLMYDIRIQGRSFSKYPRFVILDDDFVEQNPVLNEIYSKIYTIADLRKILDMSPNEIKKVVETLPQGAKESLKMIASTAVHNGTFDSLNKIKALDELLDTKMAQALFDA